MRASICIRHFALNDLEKADRLEADDEQRRWIERRLWRGAVGL